MSKDEKISVEEIFEILSKTPRDENGNIKPVMVFMDHVGILSLHQSSVDQTTMEEFKKLMAKYPVVITRKFSPNETSLRGKSKPPEAKVRGIPEFLAIFDDMGFDPVDFPLNRRGIVSGRLSSQESNISNLPKCRHGKSGKSEDCFGCAHDFDPCSPDCKGWLHMDDPYEVDACDECGRFLQSDIEPAFADEQARAAHKTECGCAWPNFDYRHAAMAWMYDIDEYYDSTDLLQGSNANVMRNFVESSGQEFMNNVIPAIFLCTQMIDREKSGTKCKKAIGGLLAMLKECRDKIMAKELTLKDFEEHAYGSAANLREDFDSPTDKL